MDATDRIVAVFDQLAALGRHSIRMRPFAEQFVFYVVSTRCEIDINGFASAYEQCLSQDEMEALIDGLIHIDESALAKEFRNGCELLTADGFYEHMNWNRVTHRVKKEIDTIGEHIGDRLWGLDEKLTHLLDD